MHALVLEIGGYFWRLIPANPILLRVVQMNGKRRRDLFIRCGYLGMLIGVVLLSLMPGGSTTGDLSALAKTSRNLFQGLSYCQLALVALLAPIFTAGAITAEKDSQTYDILLATPLSNGQIVLGSLLSRLFFVIALLISGIPVFSIIRIFGGVPIGVITQSFLIAAATAFVTGAVAMAIAVLKVGTRRTIFSFYMFIVIYMVGTFVLDSFGYLKFDVVNAGTNTLEPSKTSWLTGLNPFLALRTIYHDSAYLPPTLDSLPPELRGWPRGWYLSNPANFYVSAMFLISFVLISPSILLLRKLAQSTTSIKTLIIQKLGITRGDRTRKPRVVWNNPIAWREAKTKASAARASLLRYGFILAGLGGAVAMLVMFATIEPPKIKTYIVPSSFNRDANTLAVYNDGGDTQIVKLEQSDEPKKFGFIDEQSPTDKKRREIPIEEVMTHTGHGKLPAELKDGNLEFFAITRRLGEADAHRGLFGAAVVELAVILLIVANAAASTVTREKEDGTLDLLLSSPITSRYYIWGKLRGLVSFVLPLVAVPVVSAALFVGYDLLRLAGNWNDPDFQWIVLPEALVLLPLILVITAAFASILGMNMSLRCRKTVVAVMSSVGIVTGICGAMGWCGYSMLNPQNNTIGLAASAFSPFTLLMVLINPYVVDRTSDGYTPLFTGNDAIGNRVLVIVLTLVAISAYTATVWGMYKSMVKNFDMTIRKQSR